MPFWNRPPAAKHDNQVERSYIEQTANQAIHDLAASEDPRNSIAVEMMLKWLWELDAPKIHALQRVFCAPNLDSESFARFLYQLVPSVEGGPPLQPFPIVVGRLHDLLTGLLIPERTPLGERENFLPNQAIMSHGIIMIGRLRAVEAHSVVCRLLSAAQFRLQKRSWGAMVATVSAFGSETDARNLVHWTTEVLLALPPDGIPDFWSRLRMLSTARDLRPVAARMRDRRAVPYLLETLPYLDEDGQSDLIIALGNIKDIRAVPALQAFAADRSKLIAPIAAHALAAILGSSHDDAAQLLRATDSRHGGNASDTLLRAASPTPSMTTPADQLLRAEANARDGAKDIKKDR